jgi:nucleoside-diphosphate-sugar epimerase
MTKHLLSFGHGYSARALTPHLLAQGFTVAGTTRTEDKAKTHQSDGVTPLIWPSDVSEGEDVRGELAKATHLLISAGPNSDGDPVLNRSWNG